jgi:cytochrome c peroxidase
MNATLPFEDGNSLFTRILVSTICLALCLSPVIPVLAASGDIITNGTIPNAVNKQPGPIPTALAGFLFEPEVPFASLKSVPTWNELEQLLDNPYLATLDPSTPGNAQGFPSYRATGITRRPGFGVTLPPLLVDPLNYNPTTGEEMRLLNRDYLGGQFSIPDQLVQCVLPNPQGVNPLPPGCPANDPNTYVWAFKTVSISAGAGRILPGQASISYNAPFAKDIGVGTATPTCIVTAETVPPEGSIMCGGDPGEPGYIGLGRPILPVGAQHRAAYSTPALPGVLAAGQAATGFLYDPGRRFPEAVAGFILPRNAAGQFGLRKPSLRVATAGGNSANPNFLINRTDQGAVATDPAALTPSNENDYVRNRAAAITLGKSLFWDMQVGSDGVQSCGTCHFNGTGTDTRTKNQINPNHLGGDLIFTLMQPNQRDLVANDFPLHKLTNPDVAGDPACTTPLLASVNAGILENNFPGGVTGLPVCDAANVVSDTNDVVSSMGVHFGLFKDIAPIGALLPDASGVKVVAPDLRATAADCGANASCLTAIRDPIPGFAGPTGNQFRRVEPRNTPTMQAAGFNFDNFWDARARHDYNGGSVFGAADPQSHVFVVGNNANNLIPTRQLIRFSSVASLATGPGLSEFEMSFLGRNWPKIAKKLLQAGVTPLANQLVDPADSALGPYSNQGGASAACRSLTGDNRSGSWTGTNAIGKPGLCISYQGLIRAAYYPALWQNTNRHLNGCYTDGNTLIHPNQCGVGPNPAAAITALDANGAVVTRNSDPFDGYVLTPANNAANPTNSNQFTQMEGNFSLFWGLGVNLWVGILVSDNTPFDQVLEANAGAFETLGEPGERGLVNDQLTCGLAGADPNYCFTELGNFKRDSNAMATQGVTGEGGVGGHLVSSPGTRTPGSNQPDPLLGLDLFFASNLSLKNPNFRTGRCGECHAVPTLTDHTMPFTFKAQLRDFIKEFVTGQPGVETLVEPLGRLRVISGFLLESEMNENGQDGVERRIANQSIVPCPTDGLAYPGGLEPGTGQGFGTCSGAAASYFDNGIYNLGVRPIDEDIGRGGNDAFGWPLSLAALMMKNLGGTDFEPGVPLANFNPDMGFGGGLFEETTQDQQLNPGVEGDAVDPKLPPYLGPFTNQINVGDSAPELDEVFSGLNTRTDIAMLEGFLDTLGPFNTAGVLNESLNMGDTTLMGTWPNVNRVSRNGSFKAPQLRNVELTGPYFHNGGKLTLRQVVDFYTRGGDFPITNAAHRDFNMVNMGIEVQSNLSEEERVALVDFLLELTDERNRFDKAPFDHPQVIVPVDGLAPDNTTGRAALLANPMFMNVVAVGAAGQATPERTFLNVNKVRVSGTAADRGMPACDYNSGIVSHYCH